MNDLVDSVVKYRIVLNDAAVGDWEYMHNLKPPTLRSLVRHLRACPGWDFRNLTMKFHCWDKHVIGYGPRAQFWLPVVPTEEDLNWLKWEKETVLPGSYGVFGDMYFFKQKLITEKG
jgi:hypothetical protein